MKRNCVKNKSKMKWKLTFYIQQILTCKSRINSCTHTNANYSKSKSSRQGKKEREKRKKEKHCIIIMYLKMSINILWLAISLKNYNFFSQFSSYSICALFEYSSINAFNLYIYNTEKCFFLSVCILCKTIILYGMAMDKREQLFC